VSGPQGLIIAIDGVAGSGKSTTAKLVASRLGYMHIDTGAMYRAVALKMLRVGVEPTDNGKIDDLLNNTHVSQRESESQLHILLDGRDVSDFAVGWTRVGKSAGAQPPRSLAA
jgi:cytidylate kinase